MFFFPKKNPRQTGFTVEEAHFRWGNVWQQTHRFLTVDVLDGFVQNGSSINTTYFFVVAVQRYTP